MSATLGLRFGDMRRGYVVMLGSIYILVMTLAWANPEPDQVQHLAAFKDVHVTGPVRVLITQSDVQRVTVSDPSDTVDIESVDQTLYIESDPSDQPLLIKVQSAYLGELVVKGPAQVEIHGFSGKTLVLDGHNLEQGTGRISADRVRFDHLLVSGVGQFDFDLHGSATHQDVSIRGKSRYGAEGLLSKTSVVAATGMSEVRLWAEELLDLDVDGATEVVYLGSPWVNKHVSGTARIEPRFRGYTTSL